MDAAGSHPGLSGSAPHRSRGRSPKRPAAEPGRFGALLRFWRRAFGLSQEDLAGLAEISVRHISFLENGHTVPSRHAVSAIAGVLALGSRETAMMLLAAGHAPTFPNGGVRPDSLDLNRSLTLALRHADPLPSMVMERSGRILFVNKAWVALHHAYLGDLIDDRRLNALELLIDERGWRRYVHDWADVASVFLMLLTQDMMINPNAMADRTITACLALPGVPHDWARRGAMLSPSRPDYTLRLEGPDGYMRAVRVVHAMIETGPPDTHPALVLQTCYPEDGGQLLSASMRLALPSTSHPLCPY